ncbi:ABC transporter permease [Chloroflexi bacterium TSY]|nr:ABC transporter permease [Chloroflexi bacterium TSY]
MSKILNFAWKELYTTFQDRNLILIMFITPIVISTVMGLAFGGLGSGSDSSGLMNIPIAIVNLDEGANFGDRFPESDGAEPSLSDLEFAVAGEPIPVGTLLLQNDNLAVDEADLSSGDASFNFGDQLVSILLAETVTATETTTSTNGVTETNRVRGGFNLADLTCPLFEDQSTNDNGNPFGFEGTLADLFDATEVSEPDEAKAAVERGEYVAAIIIPAGFSNGLSPAYGVEESATGASTESATSASTEGDTESMVEIYANSGHSIQSSIVRAVVEGIVNQLVRISVAIDAVLYTAFDTVGPQLLTSNMALTTLDVSAITEGIQSIDSSILEPLGCMILPKADNVQLTRQPLDEVQKGSAFSVTMVLLVSSQAIFFALFTGIFGMYSIYDERNNWTLQRLFATPMPRSYILIGKMLGNIVVVAAQLTVLFLAFTMIASIVEGRPIFLFGSNVPLLAATILAISIFVSGVGVLVVGIAATPAQVQTFGPIISMGLGVLGGAFGFSLPPEVASISPVWWGSEALQRLAANEPNILMPLVVLFGVGAILFAIGSAFFRRRMEL